MKMGSTHVGHCLDSPLHGEADLILDVYLGLRAGRFSPGYHIIGFQPANWTGLKARNVIAWAGASPTSAGPGQPPPKILLAL